MVDCLKGCTGAFANPGRLKLPLDATLLMPWVKANIGPLNGPGVISVSNISSRTNQACIKSFTFGMSNGLMAEIEIVDESGGKFRPWFDKISKGVPELNWVLEIQWGWAHKGCMGPALLGDKIMCDPRTVGPTNQAFTSCEHRMRIDKIRCKTEKGLFKYVVECSDITDMMFETRVDQTIGTDKSRVPLVTAIREVMSRQGADVDFITVDNPGAQASAFRFFVDGDVDSVLGPKAVWNSHNRNPLEVVLDWAFKAYSQNKKGVMVLWDTRSINPRPKLIFIETTKTYGELLQTDPLNVGTYIVNGGQCSPVLSFSPSFEWRQNQANDAGGFYGTKGRKIHGPKVEPGTDTPNQYLIVPNDQGQDYSNLGYGAGIRIGHYKTRVTHDLYNVNEDLKGVEKQLANQIANLFFTAPIKAELRIQGDPSYSNPIFCQSLFATIVYIDPFYIGSRQNTMPTPNQQDRNTCDWIVNSPGCDPILTNRNWRIAGVFHEIREGSYTTTLQVVLDTPGITIPRQSPLGADAKAPTIPQG